MSKELKKRLARDLIKLVAIFGLGGSLFTARLSLVVPNIRKFVTYKDIDEDKLLDIIDELNGYRHNFWKITILEIEGEKWINIH
jgi:hypothetical protein